MVKSNCEMMHENGPEVKDSTSEELLQDVLYSVQSLMKETDSWYAYHMALNCNLNGPSDQERTVVPTSRTVTYKDVMKFIQGAFQADKCTMEKGLAKVSELKPPSVRIQLTVREGIIKNQKTGTFDTATTNTYVRVIIPGREQDPLETKIIKDSVCPKWNEDFPLLFYYLKRDYLRVQLWRETDKNTLLRQSLSSNVKAAIGKSQSVPRSTLLGSVMKPLKDILEKKLDGWYLLEPERKKEISDVEQGPKPEVYLSSNLSLSSSAIETRPRRTHEELLIKLFSHCLTQRDIGNREKSDDAHACISVIRGHHALMTNIDRKGQQLLLWIALTEATKMDNSWILSSLETIQAALVLGSYDSEDKRRLGLSILKFTEKCMKEIKHLDTVFPVSDWESSKCQLSYMLEILHSIQSHPQTRDFINEENQPLISESVVSALHDHADYWWISSAEPILQGTSADNELKGALDTTSAVHNFLRDASNFYSDIFLKNGMRIPCLHYLYEGVVRRIDHSLGPVIKRLCNDLNNPVTSSGGSEGVKTDFGVGSSLSKIYMNLKAISVLGQGHSESTASQKSGSLNFCEWFVPAVHHWTKLTQERALAQVPKFVQADQFEPLNAHTPFSSSAMETTGLFHNIKTWWYQLGWPDTKTSYEFSLEAVRNMCSISEFYSDTLSDSIDRILKKEEEESGNPCINQKVCTVLANMDKVKQELHRLPELFRCLEFLEKMKKRTNETEFQALEKRLEANSSILDNVQEKTSSFIKKVVQKMEPNVKKYLTKSCKTGNADTLLMGVLDPAFQVLRENQYFQEFLWGFWENILKMTMLLIDEKGSKSYSYFQRVYEVLGDVFQFFTPTNGIDPVDAKNPDYVSIMERLELLRMSSDEIIAEFYRERCQEQALEDTPKKASLHITTSKNMEKLTVNVVMLKDIEVAGNRDCYVKVQVVPRGWFSEISSRRTKICSEDPAVFDEDFEFDLSSPSDDHIKSGILLLTLKCRNRCGLNTYIGEALVPLKDLQEENSQMKGMELKMTSPAFDQNYESLQTLQLRQSKDVTASSFLTKLSRRHPTTRLPRRNRICLFINRNLSTICGVCQRMQRGTHPTTMPLVPTGRHAKIV